MNIGDYVRTKDGIIGKIIDFHNDPTDYYFQCYETNIDKKWGYKYITEYDENINLSPNIIDLIEVGDYVNGYKVLFAGATTWDNDGNVIDKRVKINYAGYDRWLSEDFIKSIVTKEQFESMKYEVK